MSNSLLRFLRTRFLNLLVGVTPFEWALACAALLAVVQYALLPRDVFFAPDEGMRLIVARNLRADSVLTGLINYENRAIDPSVQFAPYFDQWFAVVSGPELRVSYPIVWFAALIAPLYAVGGVVLAQLFPLLCGALAGFLAGRILDRIAGRFAATLGVIVVMLALPSSLYSLLLWEHQLTLALSLLALTAYLEYQTRRRRRWAAIGAAAVLAACALRVETVFVVAPALACVGWEQFLSPQVSLRERRWLIGVVAATLVLLFAVYWLIARDTPYRLPALAPAIAPAQVQRVAAQVIRVLIGHDASIATTLALFGVLGIGGAALLAARGNVIARAGIGAGILIAVTAVTALSILRVEPFRMTNPGLLGGSPLAVLAVLPAGIVTVKTPSLRFLRPAIAVILVGFVVGAFLMPRLASRAGGVMVQIGSTWGSRYFLMLYPLLALVALTHVTAWLRAVQHGDASSVQRRWRTAGAVALGAGISVSLIGSFLVNGVGLARMITDKSIVWAGCQAVWRTEAPVLVTDDWWLAPECAARPTLAYLLVENPDMLPILTSNLYAAGTTQLAYASQTGRLSLNALIASLERCFLVQTVQGQPAGQQGGPVVLNLTPRSPTCPDTSHTFEYQVDQS